MKDEDLLTKVAWEPLSIKMAPSAYKVAAILAKANGAPQDSEVQARSPTEQEKLKQGAKGVPKRSLPRVARARPVTGCERAMGGGGRRIQGNILLTLTAWLAARTEGWGKQPRNMPEGP